MTKRELRTMIRRLKAERLSAASSSHICDRVLRHARVVEARTVLLYHPLHDEVDVTLLLSAFAGKRLLLPVVVDDDLELREYTGATRTGAFGIEEPVGPLFTDYDSIDVALVPGMAFTRDGRRLGRGRGYYDRLLPRLSRVYNIGICHDWQVVDDIPTEAHDVVMDEIIC